MRLTLIGTGITLPAVGKTAARYNLANAYLHAYLAAQAELRASVEVTRIDLPISLDAPVFDSDVLARVVATRPDIVGLSCYCWDLAPLLELARNLELELPGIRIVLGGPSPSVAAAEILATNPQVDAIVRGEGERTLAEVLARGFDHLDGVLGVSWRDSEGKLHEEPDRPAMEDLGQIPSPLLSNLLEPPRQNLIFEFARGCRYRCTYCAWKLFGRGVRHHGRERVRLELEWAISRGYEHAFVIDSALNDDDARLADIARAVSEVDPDRRLAFSYFVNHKHLTPAQIADLRTIRSHEITVGLESVNAKALRAAGRRPLDREGFTAALDLLAEVGPATLSIMLGMPGDDLQGFSETLDFIARLADRPGPRRIRSVRVHWMMVAPGSALHRRASKHGIELAVEGVPYVLESSSFPRDDLLEALRVVKHHPRSDLFVWEDAEPWKALQRDQGEQMYAAGGDHLGGRAGQVIEEAEVWRALRPLRPGRRISGSFEVEPLSRVAGFPVVTLRNRAGRSVRLQIRPRGAEPRPLASTPSFDLVWLLGPSVEQEQEAERKVLSLLVELIRRNEERA